MTQITKVGHFYMAQLGHYHVAATQNDWWTRGDSNS